jgi:hypothetical protein
MRKRSHRSGRAYAAIPNAAMRDNSLSIEARGLLALLMTYSDSWTFIVSHLQSVTGVGRDKLRGMLKELEAAGYVVREVIRGETGKLKGTEWVIVDDPTDPTSCASNDDGDLELVDPTNTRPENRPPENTSIGADRLKNRPPEKPTACKSVPLRRTTDKKKNKNKNPLTPSANQDTESLAKGWVAAVQEKRAYASSAISVQMAQQMLRMGLVTENDLRQANVNF